MSLPLTPEILQSVYDLLLVCPPFNNWNLPDSDDIKFKVVRTRGTRGWYRGGDGTHEIAVSETLHGHLMSVIATIAHEMCHIHLVQCGGTFRHSKAFYKLVEEACTIHGLDPKFT